MRILSKLDNTGMIEETTDKRYVTDAEKSAWNGKADKTYVDNKVKTNVPSGAKFTDTVTTVNGKTGAITKADITALGIPAQDTVIDISGKADKAYVDNKVKTDVPAGAKFTDTVYTHPASHPASMITGLPTSLPANGGNADTVGGFTVGTNVPANAKFTDTNTTYSEISTAEIDAGTASTSRAITGRRVKYILDKISSMISVAIGSLTKSSVGLGNVDNTSDANKPISTATQTALNGKVNNSQVLTNVPANAKFTDTNTITTINGKTGAISKADITALGIPAQDTVYTHPSSHPASMITESSTRRFVSDSEKSTWNSKPDTDTVTTINGKTGAISKADIVALGIPSQNTNTTYSEITTAEIDAGTASTGRTITGRRVKYILDKVQGWIGGLTKSDVGLGNVDNLSAASIRSGTTKADVGLGNVDNLSAASIRSGTTKANVGLSNVDNVKQMPISSGVLENHREKLVPVTAGGGAINLNLGNVFQHTPSGNRTYSITNAVNGEAHSFTLIINMGTTVRALTFPSSVKWQSGEVPDMSSPSRTYVLTFISVNGGTTWLGMFAGQLSLKGLMDYSYVSDTHVVKYGNGVMEQWKSAFAVGAPNTQRGSIYVTTDYTWNFPVAFAEIPTVVPTVRGGVGMTWAGLGNTVTTTTSTSLAGYSAVSSNGIISCSVHAIGRWK